MSGMIQVSIPQHILDEADALWRKYPDRFAYRFTSDGCSGLMSWTWWTLTGRAPPWEGCCVGHDFEYWCGGTAEDRRRADKVLRECVASRGFPFIGWVMEKAVRVGGVPWRTARYRWAYGSRWPSGYVARPWVTGGRASGQAARVRN